MKDGLNFHCLPLYVYLGLSQLFVDAHAGFGIEISKIFSVAKAIMW